MNETTKDKVPLGIKILMCVPLFWLWVFIHESTHALVALLQGLRVTEFKPYPQKVGDKWWFGKVATTPRTNPSAIRSLAPYIVDIIVSIGLFITGLFIGLPWGLVTLAIAFAPLSNTATVIFATYTNHRHSDLSAWRTGVYGLLMIFSLALMIQFVIIAPILWMLP